MTFTMLLHRAMVLKNIGLMFSCIASVMVLECFSNKTDENLLTQTSSSCLHNPVAQKTLVLIPEVSLQARNLTGVTPVKNVLMVLLKKLFSSYRPIWPCLMPPYSINLWHILLFTSISMLILLPKHKNNTAKHAENRSWNLSFYGTFKDLKMKLATCSLMIFLFVIEEDMLNISFMLHSMSLLRQNS